MTAYAFNAGVWKPAISANAGRNYVYNAGVWKLPKQGYAYDAGVWKPLFPPMVQLIAYTQFPGAGNTTFSTGTLAFPDDCLVVGALAGMGNSSRSVTGITVGGVSGTVHATSSGNLAKAGIGSKVVTAGSYVVTMSLSGGNGSSGDGGLAVWALVGYRSATPVGADGTAKTATSISVSFDRARDGVALFGALINNNPSWSWSSATEDFTSTGAISRGIHFASNKNTVAGTAVVETLTPGSSQNMALAGASWS